MVECMECGADNSCRAKACVQCKAPMEKSSGNGSKAYREEDRVIRLMCLQRRLQKLWDRIDWLEKMHAYSGNYEDKLMDAWHEYHLLEARETKLLRTGRLLIQRHVAGGCGGELSYSAPPL